MAMGQLYWLSIQAKRFSWRRCQFVIAPALSEITCRFRFCLIFVLTFGGPILSVYLAYIVFQRGQHYYLRHFFENP